MVELSGDDGDGHIDQCRDALQVSPNTTVPIRISIIGMSNPIPVVIKSLPEHVHVCFDLGTVEIEVVIVLARTLPVLSFGVYDVLFCIINYPAAHYVLAEQTRAITGNLPVDTVMAKV